MSHPPLRGTFFSGRLARRAAGALALLSVGVPARGASIDVQCPGMPPALRADLEARANQLLFAEPSEGVGATLECDQGGAWITWSDGSRGLIDQTSGLVQGALDLLDRHLLQGSRDPVDPYPAPAPLPPRRRSEGGIGLGMMTGLWTDGSFMGMGPRLDLSIGPPGLLSILIAEGALFGGGGSPSTRMMLFDLQAGAALGAPFKTRSGFGGALLFGAERIGADTRNDISSGATWVGTADLGLRGSLPLRSVNLWVGTDLMLRTGKLESGGPSFINTPLSSFTLSLGFFFPAFTLGSRPE